MTDKKHVYQADSVSPPSLKMTLGEVPDAEPDEKNHLFQPFGNDKNKPEAGSIVRKLINFFEK